MAVYTQLNQEDIRFLLSKYELGELQKFHGIEGGVENTNYFLDITTSQSTRRYVLTLFEYQPQHTLHFFVDYIDELKIAKLPVPNAIRDKSGKALQTVKHKPALIVPCLPGHHIEHTTSQHCQQVGELLGTIHKAGLSSKLRQSNHRGLDWLDAQQQRLNPLLSGNDACYMREQWLDISQAIGKLPELPKGLIHGDLFHDNILFKDNQLSGVIDFYQSCYDYLLYDLAVTVNDWCLADNLELDIKRTAVLTKAYASIRPFTKEEKQAWPLMLRLAAFRFWISRIITFVHPEKAVDLPHQASLSRNFLDPDKFKIMLKKRTLSPAEIPT